MRSAHLACGTSPPGWSVLRLLGRWSGCRLELYLDPARLAPVEGLVGLDGAREGLSKDLRRVQGPCSHEPHQHGHVLTMVAVAAPEGQVPLLDGPDRSGHRLRREDPYDPYDPGLHHGLRRPDHGLRR